jgi:hypothetical protein
MKKFTYSNEITAVVKQFLDGEDWHYSFDENRGILDFGLRNRSKIQKIKYLVDVKDDEIIFYGICPIGADRDDAEMMAQMAEFLCRANYGLKNGSFEFDFRDGEIRYKSFVDCDGVLPSTEVVKNSIYCIDAMYKRYAPGIVDIIFAGCSAKDAIAKCEKSPEEELRSLFPELGEDAEGGDMAEMLTRLAEHLGITEGDESEGGEETSAKDAAEIHMDLFSKKEDEA